MGQSHHFGSVLVTSGLPPTPDMRKTDCRLTWLNSLLMRYEYGHGHRGQYAARRTAKYEFA
jgi:hypothetical protein